MEKFRLLIAKPGNILYVRLHDTVTAVKIVKFACGKTEYCSFPFSSRVHLIYAGSDGIERVEHIEDSISKKRFYRTIEDCINEINPIEKLNFDRNDIAELCGMRVVKNYSETGYGYYGVWKYKWDGFKPKKVCVSLDNYIFINDEYGWHCEVYKNSYEKEPTKYYDTYEKCLADNKVQVVVF